MCRVSCCVRSWTRQRAVVYSPHVGMNGTPHSKNGNRAWWSPAQAFARSTLHGVGLLALLAMQTLGCSGLRDGVAQQCVSGETERQMHEVVASVERFTLEHHRYPTGLDELVPAYLPRRPRAWAADSTCGYRYVRDSDGVVLALSVPDGHGRCGPRGLRYDFITRSWASS